VVVLYREESCLNGKYSISDRCGDTVHDWTILNTERLVGDRCYQLWEVECKCGFKRFIQPSTLFGKNSPKSCRKCNGGSKRGNNSPHWKGVEEVPYSVLSKIRNTLNRSRVLECSISIDDLESQWVKQGGRCALSGIPLCFSEVQYTNPSKERGNASVDRIDSSVGYVSDNIQFVDKRINIMKQDMDQKEFIDLCKKISEYDNE